MSVNKCNSEGYYDPTAYEALAKIEREAKAHAFRTMMLYKKSRHFPVEEKEGIIQKKRKESGNGKNTTKL